MRRLRAPVALILLTLVSLLAASLAGITVMIVAVYLYDRGNSKGNDLAVSLIAVHAAGTFTFVTMSTFLWARRGIGSWGVPIASLTACVSMTVFDNVRLWSNFDEYFAVFFYAAWIAVAICGAAALVLSRCILSSAASRSARANSL